MAAYYNEIDPFAAKWLRNLISLGVIAAGDVDERSIEDVTPNDLRGYTQCHFFAGIGGWAYALDLAGWPRDRPVWTGSCPCQPFSSAGKGAGFADERHLWPAFHWLIGQCHPAVVFGEQVASKDGLRWLDLVHADLEASGYAVGAADLCAAGVGAPHIRQRLYWVADADDDGSLDGVHAANGRQATTASERGSVGGLADSNGRDTSAERQQRSGEQRQQPKDGGCGVVLGRPNPLDGFWREADWLGCRDGKWRPVEPGTFPLAHGLPARVGRLRGYGNAIVPEAAAAFIRAYAEAVGIRSESGLDLFAA